MPNAPTIRLMFKAVIALVGPTSAGYASDYPCSLGNSHVLIVKSWSAETTADGRTNVFVTARLNDRLPPGFMPEHEQLAKLSGWIKFEATNGAEHAFFSISDPGGPVGSENSYVFRRTIEPNSNVTAVLASPKSDIHAFVCLSNWTWTNGAEGIAN